MSTYFKAVRPYGTDFHTGPWAQVIGPGWDEVTAKIKNKFRVDARVALDALLQGDE